MSLFDFFKSRSPNLEAAQALYAGLVRQARSEAFYTSWGVADTPDGRYDLLALHAYLLMRRLKRDGEASRDLAQCLFDVMFSDMDRNLRELGVSDLAIGKRIKALAEGFYGRIAAYDAGLDDDDKEVLAQALRRNLYRKMDPDEQQVTAMLNYIQRLDDHLAALPLAKLSTGELTFVSPGITPP